MFASTRRKLAGAVDVIFVALVVGIYIRPGAATGIGTLDFSRFLLPANAALSGTNPLVLLAFGIWDGLHSLVAGPCAVLPIAVWLATPSFRVVLDLHTAMVAANFATFYFLVKRLTGSWLQGAAAVVFAFCAVQFRVQGDALSENLLVVPAGLECMLLALVVCAEMQIDRRRMLTATILIAVGIGFVPGFAVLAAAPAVLILLSRRRSALAKIFGIAWGSLAVAGAIALVLATGLAHGATAVAISVIRGLLAPLPLVYRAGGAVIEDQLSDNSHDSTFDTLYRMSVSDWLIVVLCAIVVFACIVRVRRAHGTIDPAPIAVGAALWVASSFFPLYGGAAALFGFALVAVSSLMAAGGSRTAHRRLTAVVAAFAVMIVLYGNIRADAAAREAFGRPWQAYGVLRRAAEYGLFESLPNGSNISLSSTDPVARLVDGSRADSAEAMLFSATGRRFGTRRTAGSWLLEENALSQDRPSLKLVELRGSAPMWTTLHARMYEEFSSVDVGRRFVDDLGGGRGDLAIRFDHFDDERATADVRRVCAAVPIADAFLPSGASIQWGDGFLPNEVPTALAFPIIEGLLQAYHADADPPWRYARSHARLIVRSYDCISKAREQVSLRINLYSQFPGTVSITSDHASPQLVPVNAGGTHAIVDVDVDANTAAVVNFVIRADRVPLDPLNTRADSTPVSDAVGAIEIKDIVTSAKGGS